MITCGKAAVQASIEAEHIARLASPPNDGKDSHHMPADDISPLKRNDGPAVQMDRLDHAMTQSNGQGGMRSEAAQKHARAAFESWKMAYRKGDRNFGGATVVPRGR